MLLDITNKCLMNCSHCMVDATEDGEHMTMETFYKCVSFIKKIKPLVLLVSGGEPLEHPHFFTIIEELLKFQLKETLLIVSNGMFLNDEELTKKVLDLGLKVQITNDERYYPNRINMNVKHKNLVYETHIRSLTPQGRAKGMMPIMTKAPKCFNFRSIIWNNVNSFYDAVKMMESLFKFCEPAIVPDGTIRVGESRLCTSIGNVSMNDVELYENVKKLKCNNCSMCDYLSDMHRKAIKI